MKGLSTAFFRPLGGLVTAPAYFVMLAVRYFILFVFIMALAACGKGFKTLDPNQAIPPGETPSVETIFETSEYVPVGEGLSVVRPTTYVSDRIRFTKNDVHDEKTDFRKVYSGLTIKNLKHKYDPATKLVTLTGEFYLNPQGQPVKKDFSFSGTATEGQSRISMEPQIGSEEFKKNFRAVVSNCQIENACEDFNIQFFYYIPSEKRVYIEQVFPQNMLVQTIVKKSPEEKEKERKEKLEKERLEREKKEKEEAERRAEEDKNKSEEQKAKEKREREEREAQERQAREQQESEQEHEDEFTEIGNVLIPNVSDQVIIDQFPDLQDAQKIAIQAAGENQKVEDEVLPLAEERYAPEVIKILKPYIVGIDQAQGLPHKGSLKNSVNLTSLVQQMGPLSGVHLMAPEMNFNYGTSELVSIVAKVGQWVQNYVPNFQTDVRTMSNQKGGQIKGHKSHQSGLDADIGYIFKTNNTTQIFQKASNEKGVVRDTFMVDKQWDLFKALFKTNQVEFIIVSKPVKQAICTHVQKIKEYTPDKQAILSKIVDVIDSAVHDTHFHLRIKCGPKQGNCLRWGVQPLDPCPKR